MKWALILLIIANIGVAMWGVMTQEKEGHSLFIESEAEKIKLIKETRPEAIELANKKRRIEQLLSDNTPIPRSAAKGRAENKGTPEERPNKAVCWKIAYFNDRQQAEQAKHKLFSQSIAANIKEDPKADKILGYNVIMLPREDLKTAKKMQQTLLDAGFEDVWLHRSGSLKYGFSLGLFNSQNMANNYSQKAANKGFKTIVREKTKKATLYYLEFNARELEVISLAPLQALLYKNQAPVTKQYCQ